MLISFLGLLSSCVSRKQLTYLQDSENENADTTSFHKVQRTLYKVQPNDIVNITIQTLTEKSTDLFNSSANTGINGNSGDLLFYLKGFNVDVDGNISLPVVGKVYVQGQDVEEIRITLEDKLGLYFKESGVHIDVKLAGIRFSVVGDVVRPGRFTIYQNQVNIFEALAMSGDISLVGDRQNVQIIRQKPGGLKVVYVDLTDKSILESPYFFIQPNDVINVKPLGVKSVGIGTSGFGTFAAILGVLASTATLIFTISQINR